MNKNFEGTPFEGEFWKGGCPNCGGKGYQMTMGAYFLGKDMNRWVCIHGHSRNNIAKGCGATGYVIDWPEHEIREEFKIERI